MPLRDLRKWARTMFSALVILRVVTRDEIRQNEYNLNIPRYVDSSEKAESWDIFASMNGGIPVSELEEMQEYWSAFPALKDILFTAHNPAYYGLKVSDIKEAVASSADIKNFYEQFANAFADFEDYLTGGRSQYDSQKEGR